MEDKIRLLHVNGFLQGMVLAYRKDSPELAAAIAEGGIVERGGELPEPQPEPEPLPLEPVAPVVED